MSASEPHKAVPWRPSATRARLLARARLATRTREFFARHGVLEVTTPLLSRYPIPTPAIDSFKTSAPRRYLRTSPELALKRLLAADIGDVFELGPVFRVGEQGHRHNPEFTLLEWYRVGWDEHRLMAEVASLLAELLPGLTAPHVVTYADALQSATGLCPFTAPDAALTGELEKHTAPPDAALSRDDLLDLLFATAVAPGFADSALTFVHDYPASQAALAQVSADDPRVARRFEVYLGSLELGNGFYELRDADEQRARFEADNAQRRADAKPPCDADEAFLAALTSGLPECAGVAVGFDRVVMLATGAQDIAETLSFSFDLA